MDAALYERVARLENDLEACRQLIGLQNTRISSLEAKLAGLVLEHLLGGDDERVRELIMSLEEGE